MSEDSGGVRLAKRVAELKACSRAEAERYIEGGWVSVNGEVVELPQHRVSEHDVVTLATNARATCQRCVSCPGLAQSVPSHGVCTVSLGLGSAHFCSSGKAMAR